MPVGPILEVSNLGQIRDARVEFGHLTVLVGPQATGKSLLLQCLQLGVDGLAVRRTLRQHGFEPHEWHDFIDLVFGEGMHTLWSVQPGSPTSVAFEGKAIEPKLLTRRAATVESARHRLLLVPAQRTLTMPTGFPRSFREFGPDAPFAVRRFSSLLHDSLVNKRYGATGNLFPITNQVRESIRRQIDGAIFHGSTVGIDSTSRQPDLRLHVPGASGVGLPIMAWTAGQREFLPLLLGLYPLLPPGAKRTDGSTDWVVIEEPEMGLHPEAILAVMTLVMHLVGRGYRVVLSTHHPLVLDVVWALQQFAAAAAVDGSYEKHGRQLSKVLTGRASDQRVVGQIAEVLTRSIKVHSMHYGADGRVATADISSLDPASEDATIRGWGGLTGVSEGLLNAVASLA